MVPDEPVFETDRDAPPIDTIFVEFRTRTNSLRLVRADLICGFGFTANGPAVFLENDECLLLHPSWTYERFVGEVLAGLSFLILEDTYAIRSV